MIYYGLLIINPSIFLPACVILCAVVSLATGSSWSTSATIGVALIGIGKALGLPAGIVAGAAISGAYFGDKLSPLSDTTNLAPAVSGAKLFQHIKYMTYTTVPSILITIIILIGSVIFQYILFLKNNSKAKEKKASTKRTNKSSAYKAMFVPSDTQENMSFIKSTKRRGPRIEPWGTPDFTGNTEDLCPPITTCCWRSSR